MTLDCKLHRKMKQSRVISCAWPHGPFRTVAFMISLLPCPTRFVSWLVERAYFVRGRMGRFARWPLSFRYCLSLPGSSLGSRKGYFFCLSLVGAVVLCAANPNLYDCRWQPYSYKCPGRPGEFHTQQHKQFRPAWREQAPALRVLRSLSDLSSSRSASFLINSPEYLHPVHCHWAKNGLY